MIYWPIIHRLARGHKFNPHTAEYDKWGIEYWDGCATCLEIAPIVFRADRHRMGLCPKTIGDYTCHGGINECGN